jgi:ribulose-5-phosphate 4-epimerase/fuculose-1-phosphate aldolase
MKNELSTLVSVSLQLGRNPFWVQGSGGNTSVKNNDGTMIVKSSGSELQSVSENEGFAFCRTDAFNAALREILPLQDELAREIGYADAVAQANLYPERHKRPSMELGIHTLLPFKYVLHFHSPCGLIAAHLHTLQRDADFPSPSDLGFTVSWMDFCLPGFSLAEQVLRLSITHSPSPQLIILKNHGVVLCCDENPQDTLHRYAEWESAFWIAIGHVFPYSKTCDRTSIYDFAANNPQDLRPLYPDSVILETRIARVAEVATGSRFHLNPDAAVLDHGAADIFAVECLIKNKFPEIASIQPEAQQKIRDMPTEIARKKLMQGAP